MPPPNSTHETGGEFGRHSRHDGVELPAIARSRRPQYLAALAFSVLAFIVYNANLRLVPSGDAMPARFLPFALLRGRTLNLDDYRAVVAPGVELPYWVRLSRDGHLVSRYPVVTPIAVSPLYLPAVAYLEYRGTTPERLSNVGEVMEKVAASTIAAISAGLMLLLLRRRLAPRDALLLAVAFAFGTNTWVTASQTLYQHGLAQLLVILALLLLTQPPSDRRMLVAGAALGLLAAARPPDAFLSVALAIAAILRACDRRSRIFFLVAAAAPIAAVACYNFETFGSLAGGYADFGVLGWSFWGVPILRGIAGLLVSPGKGLLVFSPFLVALFLLPWASPARNHPDDRRLTACALVGFGAQVLLFAKTDWRGGWCYGPRYLADGLPILIWALVPLVAGLRSSAKAAFLVAVVVAVFIQAIGAFRYDFTSDLIFYSRPGSDAPTFLPSNAPFLVELRHRPPARPIAAMLFSKFGAKAQP